MLEPNDIAIPEDVIQAAKDAYGFAKDTGLSDDALGEALAAGFTKWEKRVVLGIATMAEMNARECLEGKDEPSPDMTASLLWFADRLKNQYPVDKSNYIPNQDDVIQVVITGVVEVYTQACDHCGVDDFTAWSVEDEKTGQTIYFETEDAKDMDIHVLSKEKS